MTDRLWYLFSLIALFGGSGIYVLITKGYTERFGDDVISAGAAAVISVIIGSCVLYVLMKLLMWAALTLQDLRNLISRR